MARSSCSSFAFRCPCSDPTDVEPKDMNKVLQTMMGATSPLASDAYTYICLLQGCSAKKKKKKKEKKKERVKDDDVDNGGDLDALNEGRIIHNHIIKIGLKHNVFLWTTIANLYARHGCGMEDAMWVFGSMPIRSRASWNVIIAGHVRHGNASYASHLMTDFMIPEGVMPDTVTVVTMLGACSATGDLDRGRSLHSYALHAGFELGVLPGNALIDTYAKCGSLEDAEAVFEGMPMQDTVSWNAMISAYASWGHPEDSLECFLRMLGTGIHAIDHVTVMCALSACASLGSLAHGLSIHSLATRAGLHDAENAAIDMYGKSGDVESCFAAFKRAQHDDGDGDGGDDRMSWNSMISCYAQSGHGVEAIELFMSRFGNCGAKPPIVASVGVISACDHAGLVDEGFWFLGEMYGRIRLCADISGAQEHHVCMIDMLGRAGQMGRALAYVDRMPCQPLANAWRSLLGACRIHGDVTKGEEATGASMELEPENEAACLLLYNTYFATREGKEEEGLVV